MPGCAPRCATACSSRASGRSSAAAISRVDLVRRLVLVRGEELRLSPREYDILRLLVAHAGKVLTHRFILREVWGGDTDVQYLRVYIRALRQKIEADPERPRHILTETGVGYRLRAPDWDAVAAQSGG